MKQRIVLVVGDKFSVYVHSKDAMTFSNLRGLLSLSIPMLPNQGRIVLVPGHVETLGRAWGQTYSGNPSRGSGGPLHGRDTAAANDWCRQGASSRYIFARA